MADRSGIHMLAPLRLAITGAIVALLFYILCWVGALVLPIGPASHMYLQLFTVEAPGSTAALVQGSLWSFVFGVLIGALTAFVYNLLARLER